jgi:hypothetical protein
MLISPAISLGQQSFVVGDDDGDGMLIYPRQVEEGRDGNIYVLDTGDSFIKVYSPEGEYLRRIGGQGEGPGKLQRADGSAFGFLPDENLFFTEYIGGHRWITFMELSGDFNRVLSVSLDEAFGIRYAHALEDGRFLVNLTLSSTPKKTSDYYLYSDPQALVLVDSNGNVASKIVETEYLTMISMIPDGATSGLPYHPIFAWIPYQDGKVVFTDGMSNDLSLLDYQGKLVRTISTALPESEPVTKDDLDEWKKAREESMMAKNPSWYSRFGNVIHKYEKSLYDKPGIAGISLTPGGHIFVAGVWVLEADRREYWLINDSGKTVAQITSSIRSLEFSDNFVLYVTSDDEGNAVVRCLRRSGDEKTDLLTVETLSNQYEN